ncbi:uncharacterized protein LOC129581681 [Paramacrobiotus metropolitanus]|uniref:uncharacterized protein LOC129581681 n=1 Tax=Paramacrobiotus metropolitanus TaxID=2943436 RepID=UPI002445B67F|nr:uncharacterized protein LOC129581681 [Paramacrobiotus metropolitanus]
MWNDLTKCLENFVSTLLLSLHAGYNLTSSQPTYDQTGLGATDSASAMGYSGASSYAAPSFWNADTTTQSYGNLVSLQGGFAPNSGMASSYLNSYVGTTTTDSAGSETDTEFGAALTMGDTITSAPAITQTISFDFSKIDFSLLLTALQQIVEQLQTNGQTTPASTETPTTTSSPSGALVSYGNSYNHFGSNSYNQPDSASASMPNASPAGSEQQQAGSLVATSNAGAGPSYMQSGSGLSSGQITDNGNRYNAYGPYASGGSYVSSSALAQMTVGATAVPVAAATDAMSDNRRYSAGMPAPTQSTAQKALINVNQNGSQSNINGGRATSSGCGIPASVPGVPIVFAKMMGGWFEYMNRLPGLRPMSNTINIYTPLGFSVLPETNNWGLVTSFNVFQYNGAIASTAKCVAIFEQSNLTADGRKIATPLINPRINNQGNPEKIVYTILAVDYETMELSYRCNKPNPKTGLCDEAFFRLSTRIDPRNLNQTMRDHIRATVNKALQPFCLGTRDLNFANWLPLPSCSQDLPSDVAKVLHGITKLLTEQNRSGKAT